MSVYAGVNPLTDERAELLFDEFVARNARFAYRVAYAMLRNPSDAEDAVQEAFSSCIEAVAGRPQRTNAPFWPAPCGAWPLPCAPARDLRSPTPPTNARAPRPTRSDR